MNQKFIGALGFDVPWGESAGRKVAQIASHNGLRAGAHGSCEHMAILGVIAHREDQRLVAFDPAIPKVAAELADEMRDLCFRKAELAFERSRELVHDDSRPAGQIETAWQPGQSAIISPSSERPGIR